MYKFAIRVRKPGDSYDKCYLIELQDKDDILLVRRWDSTVELAYNPVIPGLNYTDPVLKYGDEVEGYLRWTKKVNIVMSETDANALLGLLLSIEGLQAWWGLGHNPESESSELDRAERIRKKIQSAINQ